MFPIPIQKRPLINRISYKILVPVSLFVWLIPLIGIMLTSIRGLGDITAGNYWGIPSEFLLFSNIKDVFQNTPMLSYIINSFKITIPTVIGAVAISCMTGFALASYKFKANLFIFFTFIAGNFVPYQILMIPVRNISIDMGVYNTHIGLIIFHIAFQTGFCTFFLRNFIKELPFELIEAARADGATEWTIYRKIILPLIVPALAALGVLEFTFIWNDYFWALVLTQGDTVKPITVGLDVLRGQWTTSWNLVSAGSVVAALPPVIMFFILQKQFIQGLTFGAVKG